MRLYRYLGTGTKTTISVTQPIGASCTENTLDMYVRQGNTVVASDGSQSGPTAGCPTVTFAAQPGT